MKKLLFIATASLVVASTSAQSIYYQDKQNPDITRHTLMKEALRREFILPTVNGYQVLKSDLHTHSIYSDGSVTPDFRVREAWLDGLDVLALTDHIEYRPTEKRMIASLVKNGSNISVDMNEANKIAEDAAKEYGITFIPGIEITRTPETIGHYNALFINDANTIYDDDPAESIRKARRQGALIMHNHPGWRRQNLEMSEFEKKVYDEKLIDGVEIMNDMEFYPSVVNRALQQNLFMSANTDIHATSHLDYNTQQRNMTLILAKDNSLQAIREALEKHRTLAYSFGSVAGEEQLVKDFFLACVKFETVNEDQNGRKTVRMTNPTSMNFILNIEGSPVELRAFSSRNVNVAKDKAFDFVVENLWIPGEQQHPSFSLKF